MRIQTGPFTTAPGPRRYLTGWEIWAEDGRVMMLDKKYLTLPHALSCSTAAGRLRVFATELDVLDKSRTAAVNPSEKAMLNEQFKHRKMLCDILLITLKEAKEQGDAEDREVQIRKLRQFYRSRGPTGTGQSTDDVMRGLFGHN